MSLPRQLTFALLFVSATAGAYPRSDLPSLSFSHKDWELACDNTRTCRAAGYHTDQDEEPNATILITRAAGPGTPVNIQLRLADDERHPPAPSVDMTIDGKRMGTIELDRKTNIGTLSDTQTRALLPAILKDSKIAWRSGKTTWTISTAGANAVLLKMDDFQGRIDTPGALVRRGNKPESSVAPPLPAPVVQAAPVIQGKTDVALTAAQTRDLMAALRKAGAGDSCELLTANEDEGGKLEAHRLTQDKLLVSHICWMGAYNMGKDYWVVNTKPPYSPTAVVSDADSYGNGVITATEKGRGIGDCKETREWTWDGRTFAQTSDATTGMCRLFAGGAWYLPTLVTRVVKQR